MLERDEDWDYIFTSTKIDAWEADRKVLLARVPSEP